MAEQLPQKSQNDIKSGRSLCEIYNQSKSAGAEGDGGNIYSEIVCYKHVIILLCLMLRVNNKHSLKYLGRDRRFNWATIKILCVCC